MYQLDVKLEFSENEILEMLQKAMEKPTLNDNKKSLWVLLSRLKTKQFTGPIVLKEENFSIDIYKKAVRELLNEGRD